MLNLLGLQCKLKRRMTCPAATWDQPFACKPAKEVEQEFPLPAVHRKVGIGFDCCTCHRQGEQRAQEPGSFQAPVVAIPRLLLTSCTFPLPPALPNKVILLVPGWELANGNAPCPGPRFSLIRGEYPCTIVLGYLFFLLHLLKWQAANYAEEDVVPPGLVGFSAGFSNRNLR